MKRILLLSGTSEGPLLARALLAAGFQVRATVTRPEARDNLFGSLLCESETGGASKTRPTLQLNAAADRARD